MIVDLFAGPGGWDEGLTLLGCHDVVGLDWDADACATAEAAGHKRVQVDVAETDPGDYAGAEGLIASPPCPPFSTAGKQQGDIDALLAHVWSCRDGWVHPPAAICTKDVRSDLTLQPLRWVDAIRPEWVACEQVPTVAPLWRATAAVLEQWGYVTDMAVLNAANYGVPQTRKRAILVASRAGPVSMPAATHFDPRKGVGLFGEPWVSMAEALAWAGSATIDRRKSGAPVVSSNAPAPTVTAAAFGKSVWKITPDEGHWAHERPATTVVGSFRPDIIAAPGWRTEISRQDAPDSIRVSVEEAGVLQSFRRDYPWQGSKTKRYEQVGNAVPPLLAAAVLRQFVGGQP